MSKRYLGGVITANPATPTGPFQTGAAPGMWTTSQQLQYAAGNVWPVAGLRPNVIEDMFSTYLYTGNGATQTINNGIDLAGKGGLVWFKPRSVGANHNLIDSARGLNKFLISNDTAANGTTGVGYGVASFNSTGFSLDPPWTSSTNTTDTTQVAWTFRKQPKFFDIVQINSSTTTYNHNLGSTPGCIMVKCTDAGGANWVVYHRSLSSPTTQYLNLNNTNETQTYGAGAWSASSTQFSVAPGLWANGTTGIAYLFAHDAGGFGLSGNENVISCGGFTSDGSGEATVNLGYEPQWVMIKRIDGAGNWLMGDTMRGWVVGAAGSTNNDQLLVANTSDAEAGTSNLGYPTATGFFRGGAGVGWQFIYIAIRRGPMAVPTLGTTVFSPNSVNGSTGQVVTTNFAVDSQIWNYTNGTSLNSHVYDRLRGISSTTTESGQGLVTSSTVAEVTDGYVRGWNNTGFQVPSGINGAPVVYYNFVRAPSFFDEVCYTGTGVARTVAHNLGVAPELIIVKSRSASANWNVYAAPIWQGSGNFNVLTLNSTSPDGTYNNTIFNSTAPTASVFSIGSVGGTVNDIGTTYVAYLFATCAGVSKVGSYTGTGTTQAINCGFTTGARFVLIKRTDSTGDWYVWDSARGIVAGNDPYLLLNSTAAEVTNTDYVDTSPAGFEISSTAPAAINANGGSYIFLAIS